MLFWQQGFGQQAWAVYNSSNSPLPENSVRCITIAPDGTKWIGTDFGLAAFDDVNWTVYNTFNSGIPDNSIRSIACDSAGNVWVGTFANGLAKFDGSSWVNFNTVNSDLPDDYVRSIAIDTAGNKWVGTIGGLAFFDDVDWIVYDITNASIGSNNISALAVYPATNTVSIGTINGGMTLVNNGVWEHYTIWNSNLPDNSILGFSRDTAGTLWMATPASGLTAHLGGFAFLTLNTFSSSIQSNSLLGVSNDNLNDKLWIASIDSGIIRKENIGFTSFNMSNSPMPDNFVQSVYATSGGVIWIGTQTGGLVRLDELVLLADENPQRDNRIRVYPNPASLYVGISMTKNPAIINLYNASGERIPIQPETTGQDRYRMNVSNIHSGIYFITVVFDDGDFYTSKLVIKR